MPPVTELSARILIIDRFVNMPNQLRIGEFLRIINDLGGLTVIPPFAIDIARVFRRATGKSADDLRYPIQLFEISLGTPETPTGIDKAVR